MLCPQSYTGDADVSVLCTNLIKHQPVSNYIISSHEVKYSRDKSRHHFGVVYKIFFVATVL